MEIVKILPPRVPRNRNAPRWAPVREARRPVLDAALSRTGLSRGRKSSMRLAVGDEMCETRARCLSSSNQGDILLRGRARAQLLLFPPLRRVTKVYGRPSLRLIVHTAAPHLLGLTAITKYVNQ